MTKRKATAVAGVGALLALACAAAPAAHADAAAADYQSSRSINISTNYAWLKGTVKWTGTSEAWVDFTVHDTPQYSSYAYARVAYKVYWDGKWQQEYLQPDPVLTVWNGDHDGFGSVVGGGLPVKDVWVDLCSRRGSATYCTGWS